MRKYKNNKYKGVVSYKRALISARAITNDKNLGSEKAEKFLSDIMPYLTKKGEVRKNLSKKRIEEFNRIITDYKKGFTPTKKSVKEKQRKALETAKQRGTYTNKQEQAQIIDIFNNPAVKSLINKFGFTSDQFIMLEQSFNNINSNDINNAAEYLLKMIEKDTPEEVIDIVTNDDAFQILEEYLNNIHNQDD